VRKGFPLFSTINDMNGRTIIGLFAAVRWRDYVRLIRFPYHISFVGVLLGVAIVKQRWPTPLLRDIFLLYVSFNVLLYGGLYTINAISDAEADSQHPRKRIRPLASGAIPSDVAALLSFALIASGFLTGWAWLGPGVIPVYGIVFALNISYSFLFRNVPVADILFNSATHPPRFWLGMWLAGGCFAWDWLTLVFLFAMGIATSRRSVELNHVPLEARISLRSYTHRKLFVIKLAGLSGILLLWKLNRPPLQLPYFVTFCAYLLLVGAIDIVPRVRSGFEKLWQR